MVIFVYCKLPIVCYWLLVLTSLPFSVAHASDWLDAGWKQVEQRQAAEALKLWQQGVNQLEDKQLLIVLSLGNNLDAAIALAKQAGRAESAFVLQSVFRSKPAYYVL